jgi:hypothetical protein
MIHETPLAVSRENARKDLEQIMRRWTDGTKHVITHFLSPLSLRAMSERIGTDSELIQWVKDYPWDYGAIYVVSEGDVVYDMNKIRPGLEYYRIYVENEVE